MFDYVPSNLVPEMLILLVGQIIKPFQKLFFLSRSMQSLLVASLVIKITPWRVYGLKDDEGAISSEQCFDSRKISWNLVGEEQMRADNITGAVEAEEEANYCGSLGVTRRIDTRQGPAEDDGSSEDIL